MEQPAPESNPNLFTIWHGNEVVTAGKSIVQDQLDILYALGSMSTQLAVWEVLCILCNFSFNMHFGSVLEHSSQGLFVSLRDK